MLAKRRCSGWVWSRFKPPTGATSAQQERGSDWGGRLITESPFFHAARLDRSPENRQAAHQPRNWKHSSGSGGESASTALVQRFGALIALFPAQKAWDVDRGYALR